jgi:hypothetical protein
MRTEYFRMVSKNEHYYGIIENVPEDVNIEDVKERIQTVNEDNSEWVKIVDETFENPEIIIDWETIDYESEIDKDMLSVLDVLEESNKNDLSNEVVYTSLKFMKENPSATISEAILFASKEWIK